MNLKALLEDIKFKHGLDPDTDFDPRQLRMGTQVEKEHNDDQRISKQIAKAHLDEIPDYYTRLSKMEKQAKQEMKDKHILSRSEKKRLEIQKQAQPQKKPLEVKKPIVPVKGEKKNERL